MDWAKAFVCLGLAVLLPSYGFADPLTVPFGTTVLCELDQEVVSKEKEFSEGDVVRAHVWQDVRVGGRVIVKAGTSVYTRISRLQKARIAGRKGHLELEALSVTAVDGSDIPLEGGYDKSGKGKVGLSVALAAVVAWPLIFLKGKKAVLEPGTIFDAIVRSPIQVEIDGGASAAPVLQVARPLTVKVLYDEIDTEKVSELPLRLESTVGPISGASVVSVNGNGIPPLPVRMTSDAADSVTGMVDFKALSKHFDKGMNLLLVAAANGSSAQVLLEIEF